MTVTAEQVAEWRRLAEASVAAAGDARNELYEVSLTDARWELLNAAESAVPALCDEVERLTAQVAALEWERDEARNALGALKDEFAASMGYGG